MIVALTFGIIWVAWHQLSGISKTAKDDFLLRIDERYGSGEMAEARIKLHEFHCITERELKKPFGEHLKHDDEKILEAYNKSMSDKILEIKGDDKKAEDFTKLLIFLDFLETVAYFVKKRSLLKKDVDELLGTSLQYYFYIFKSYIYDRRTKYNDKDYCIELEKHSENVKNGF